MFQLTTRNNPSGFLSLTAGPGRHAKTTFTCCNPISKLAIETNASLGFTISQKMMKKMSPTIRYGAMSPVKPIIHHLAVFKKGLKQASRNNTTIVRFNITTMVFVARRKKLLAMS